MTEVWQEPARGGFAPDGFVELPGIDRARAIVQGLVPRTPIWRLFGIRITHASVGSATALMPASPWLQKSVLNLGQPIQGVPGTVEVMPLISSAMGIAAITTAPGGKGSGTHVVSANYIRRPTIAMESFVARARCLAAGPARATVEVHVEDAEGRLVVHSTGQIAIASGSTAPTSDSLPVLKAVVEPLYPTPDPPARPLGGAEQGTPLWRLMGISFADSAPTSCTLSMRPGDWLRGALRNISPYAIQTLLASALYTAPIVPPSGIGRGVIEHELHMAFLHGSVGPLLRARTEEEYLAYATVESHRGDSLFVTGHVVTQGGEKILAGSCLASYVDAPLSSPAVSSERALAAVLYTDIVGSTSQLERFGDARWRSMLEELQGRFEREVASSRGRLVKWTGDGALATFDSPGRAVRCARAVRDAARRQGIELRAGVHVGECELMGADVAGIAVHVAQRVMDAAEPGSIFVTSTVREAAAGSRLRFDDRGRHSLKGIEGDWQLYAVED